MHIGTHDFSDLMWLQIFDAVKYTVYWFGFATGTDWLSINTFYRNKLFNQVVFFKCYVDFYTSIDPSSRVDGT